MAKDDKRITSATLRARSMDFADGKNALRLHADFPGLYLVSTRGKKGGIRRSWIFRCMIDGKSTDRGLGSYEHVTLTEARTIAATIMAAVRGRRRGDAFTGLPESNRQNKVPTFGRCADRAFEASSKTWTASTVKLWRAIIAGYLQPLANRAVDRIAKDDVLGILSPLYSDKPAMGRKVRHVIKTTLGWAQAHNHVASNAAGEDIDGGIPKTVAVKEHHSAMPHGEIGAALDTLEETGAPEHVRQCIRLIALTGVRAEAARGAQADEFAGLDTGKPTWTVPGIRMKRRAGSKDKPFRVALSVEAAAVARGRIEATNGGLLFPTSTGKAIANSTTIRAWRKVSDGTTIHGLRTALRSWAAEQGYPREVCESVLSHRLGDSAVEASYTHGTDLCEQRRALMNSWSAYLLTERSHLDDVL